MTPRPDEPTSESSSDRGDVDALLRQARERWVFLQAYFQAQEQAQESLPQCERENDLSTVGDPLAQDRASDTSDKACYNRTQYVGETEEAIGTIDPAGRTEEGRQRVDRACENHHGRAAHGDGAEQEKGLAQRGIVQRIVQGVKASNTFNRYWRRPRYESCRGKYSVNNPYTGSLPNSENRNIVREVVSRNLEHDATDRKRQTKQRVPLGIKLLDTLAAIGGDVQARDDLFARCYRHLRPRSVVIETRTMGEPHDITVRRLLERVETMIFRVWNNAVRFAKILKHERRLNRPRSK